MSTKKLQKTLDTVKGDVRELAEAFWAFRDELMKQQAVRAAESRPSAPPPRTGHLAAGHIELFGNYEMTNGTGGRRAYRWAMEERPAREVLTLPLDDAGETLTAIGHRQRLGILLMLLRQPASANEIVEELALATTGAAYHHLNVLQRTGLVQQEQRGVFSITPERVPSLITILSGLSGLIEWTVEEVPAEEPGDEATGEGPDEA